MKVPVFEGSCTALITPFTPDGIDLERLKKLLDFQAERGTKAIVLAGTTGEAATLSDREFELLTISGIRHADGRMKIIIGIGGNDTAHCLEKARFAENSGADAVLMTTPYYNKTTQSGLVDHFAYVADRISVPLILYNVPSRTSIGIGAESYAALAAHPNVNGVKEASGDFSLISRITAECGDSLNLWCGSDDQTVPMMALGAKGVISVASNVLPEIMARICTLCLEESFFQASALCDEYASFIRTLFIETNPIPLKAAMSILGLDSGLLRLPLVTMSDAGRASLLKEMERIGLFP